MKIPEKAPQFEDGLMLDIKKIFELSKSEEMSDLFRKVNYDYMYWDKFKYIDIPLVRLKKLSRESLWVFLKMQRTGQMKSIAIKDKKHNNFGYWLPGHVLEMLHYVDQNAGGQMLVEDPQVHAGEKERYLISSIMEEAIASSQLEGAATTRKKAKEMLRAGRKPANTPEQMCFNNYVTIKNIKRFIKEPLSKELIIQIQSSITQDTLEDPTAEGRFRNEKEQNQVVDERDGKVLFVPPPAAEVDDMIDALCNYANKSRDEEFIHPVIKAIILHFALAYIHPFVDGNGRTARAIFYWYMLKNKYWLFEYLSISRILLRAPAQYARAYLYSEIDDLDLTYFLIFNLKAINLAIKSLHNYLKIKSKEVKETKQFIRKYPDLNRRQYDMLYHAVSHPDAMYTIQFHKNVQRITYQTARTDLLELEEKNFLEKQKRGKEFIFIPSKKIHRLLRNLPKE